MSRGWLIVFAKAPRPGLVKTRMSPPLSLEQCAWLYEEMLADVLQASIRFARRLELEPVLAFHPSDAAAELIGRAPPGFRLHAQRGADLAERMANAFAEASASGAPCALLRGSDSPGLGLPAVEEALQALESGQDVTLTPDQSGGYAMIGLRSPEPRLFDLPMSTAEVFDRTLRLARGSGLSVCTTSPAFDLDTPGDLGCLDSLSDGDRLDLCPRTVGAIASLPIGDVL